MCTDYSLVLKQVEVLVLKNSCGITCRMDFRLNFVERTDIDLEIADGYGTHVVFRHLFVSFLLKQQLLLFVGLQI